ncbi:MAG: HAD family hydrolase [Chloroflexota bacterium]|nr:HAD family hydrolase [Chloroflexota bacterium]
MPLARTSARQGPFPEPVPSLVLFDLDDTLCAYGSARASRLRHAFTLHRPDREEPVADPLIQEMIRASIAASPHGVDHFPDLFLRFGIEVPGAAAAAAAWYQGNPFHDLILFPDVVSTLRALRNLEPSGGTLSRRRLGVITNGPAEIQREKTELLGIGTLVDFVLISGELGIEKPDPLIFAAAMRLGGVSAAETVFVGDDPRIDVLGARGSGMRSVWMNRTGATWNEDAPPPTREVSDLVSLIDLFRSSPSQISL